LQKEKQRHDRVCVISYLCRIEVANAIELRAFRKELTADKVSGSIDAFDADIKAGTFDCLPVPPSAWDIALKLSRSHTSETGTRSLDILHVASALAMKCGTFLTFDRNQAKLARAAGLELPLKP
jgi:predicted nucleic acid-binding protein